MTHVPVGDLIARYPDDYEDERPAARPEPLIGGVAQYVPARATLVREVADPLGTRKVWWSTDPITGRARFLVSCEQAEACSVWRATEHGTPTGRVLGVGVTLAEAMHNAGAVVDHG